MGSDEIELCAAYLADLISIDGQEVIGCDGTLQHVTEWLERNKIDVHVTRNWLRLHGATCDCEFLFNVYCPMTAPMEGNDGEVC